jgi:thiosulfate/3-mercaptopyruvate sulfurtransferase
MHDETVACQVCHSAGPYKQCYGCHVGKDDQGLPYRKLELSELAFKIGLNPLKSDERPWDFVLLRHVPVTRDTFAFYGENLLPDFDAEPTWKYATPHNIQRNTPQNESCNSCHGVQALFLIEEDVAPDELEANRSVIVPEVPPPR